MKPAIRVVLGVSARSVSVCLYGSQRLSTLRVEDRASVYETEGCPFEPGGVY